jgi:hypothetical protein
MRMDEIKKKKSKTNKDQLKEGRPQLRQINK